MPGVVPLRTVNNRGRAFGFCATDPESGGFCMRKIGLVVPLLTFVVLAAGGALQAQTVTVAPTGYVTAGPGGTVQFTATVSGTTGSAQVIWLAGGKVGGSATVGTIGAARLCTAPVTVPANPTLITAALTSNTKITGTQYVYLLSAGPQIASVTPNPMPSGNVNLVTVTGSGFEPGAVLWDGNVQLSATRVNSTTMTAGDYHA